MTGNKTVDLDGTSDPDTIAAAVEAAAVRAFTAETATRQRTPHHLGISSLSGCTRRCAYAVAGTPATDTPEPDQGRSANLGTWQHAGLLPRLAEQITGARTELPVTLTAAGLAIPGHVDLDAPGMLLDLKTVGEWRLQQVRRNGPYAGHLLQVASYALARLQDGHGPRWMVLLYLDRASGETELFAIRHDNQHVTTVVSRAREIRRWADDDPDTTPRRDAVGAAMLGPGYAWSCNSCPWLRRCWGDDAKPGERPRHEHDDAAIEALLIEYIGLSEAEGNAKRRKAEIAKLLETARYGTYGVARYRRAADSVLDDPYAAVETLRSLGYDVPQSPRRGRITIGLVKQTTRKRKEAARDQTGDQDDPR